MSAHPTLIVLGGFAGAGKTTIATKLGSEYHYPVFSSDAINDALRAALHKSFKEVSPTAYEVMWHLVRKQLQLGLTIIVDTNMAMSRSWETIDAIKADLPNTVVVPIVLKASFDTHQARIEERGRANKEHLNLGGDKLEDVMFKYEFIENLKRADIREVDANGTPEEVYALVKQIVDAREIIRRQA